MNKISFDENSNSLNLGCVVVVYNNTENHLNQCLRAIKDNKISECVVVDNGQSDMMKKITLEQGFRYLSTKRNEGFSSAANQGSAIINSDTVLFLNPDALLDSTATFNIERTFGQHPKVGIIGLSLINDQNKTEHHSFGMKVSLWSLFARKLPKANKVAAGLKVDWVSGGALAIRRKVLMDLGGFDPGYFLYWEDVDLCFRAQKIGWQVLLLEKATAKHVRGASLSNNSQKTTHYDNSADRYFRRHYPYSVWIFQRLLRKFYRFFIPQVH